MTTASTSGYVPFRRNRFLQVLCALFLIVWVASAIRPIMLFDWWLENLLVFLFVGVLVATYPRLAFSQTSYLLIFLYLCLHEWGAHYKYAIVPMGEWMKHAFHTVRNDYDRVVHFAFGFLLAYPQREFLMRKARIGGRWALWLPVAISLAFGAAYEMIEALVASLVSADAGEAFLGLQGDFWDTQKDMFMALAGSAVAMGATSIAASLTRVKPVSVRTKASTKVSPKARAQGGM
jgi:putative membrane protein